MMLASTTLRVFEVIESVRTFFELVHIFCFLPNLISQMNTVSTTKRIWRRSTRNQYLAISWLEFPQVFCNHNILSSSYSDACKLAYLGSGWQKFGKKGILPSPHLPSMNLSVTSGAIGERGNEDYYYKGYQGAYIPKGHHHHTHRPPPPRPPTGQQRPPQPDEISGTASTASRSPERPISKGIPFTTI